MEDVVVSPNSNVRIADNDPRLRGWPMGSIFRRERHWEFKLKKTINGIQTILFFKKYPLSAERSDHTPPPEAIEDRYRESDTHGMTRNKCRVLPSGKIEMALTQGQVTTLSPELLDQAIQYCWFANWNNGSKRYYCFTSRPNREGVSEESLALHRFLTGAKDGDIIDHIDGNGLNNTLENLQITDRSGNNANKIASRNSRTGIIGVSPIFRQAECRGYAARCKKHGIGKHKDFLLSAYGTLEAAFDAARAWRHTMEDELEMNSARRLRGPDYVEVPKKDVFFKRPRPDPEKPEEDVMLSPPLQKKARHE